MVELVDTLDSKSRAESMLVQIQLEVFNND